MIRGNKAVLQDAGGLWRVYRLDERYARGCGFRTAEEAWTAAFDVRQAKDGVKVHAHDVAARVAKRAAVASGYSISPSRNAPGWSVVTPDGRILDMTYPTQRAAWHVASGFDAGRRQLNASAVTSLTNP